MRIATLLFLLIPSLAEARDLVFEPVTAFWAAVEARQVVKGSLNPDNRTFQAPDRSALLEIRPDWKAKADNLQLTARPRFIASSDHFTIAGAGSSASDLRLRWSEAFLSWNATESLFLAYGLQNFQWGPAESSSPSNRIFRETVQARDTLYVVKGKHLLRFGFTPNPSWSEVLLFEPSDNGDPEPEPYQSYSMKVALKSEFSWAGGSDFAGVVTGWRDRAGYWLGEYANIETLSGLFLYFDASQQRGSLAFYPGVNSTSGLTVLSQSRKNSSQLFHFVVAGARYAFENGNDLRLEGIFQQAGYTPAELAGARAAASSRNPLQLLALATTAEAVRQPGLEFPGQYYLHSSVRFPNAFNVRDWTIYLRSLFSLQDHSLSGFLSTENAVGTNGTVLGSVGTSLGPDDKELKGTVDFSATLAYRHAW